jgi:amino-acid N-acetyltransferase
VAKETLPLKVWSDCVRCPKRDGCDEIAMVRTLADVPVFTGPAAAPTPRGVSIPVLSTSIKRLGRLGRTALGRSH